MMLPLTAYSWTVEDSNVASKILDKSSFLHSGTGIPKEIRFFFLADDLAGGETRPILLVHDGKTHSAHIDMEARDTARTQLLWRSDFASILNATFPYHYQQYKAGKEPESKVILRLERVGEVGPYRVGFAGEVTEPSVTKDIEAEDVEAQGPRLEGGVKEYFGKRYERDPINRQQAIRYHGLACNVCGFNFEKVYGERGSGYIEVHHLKPISTFVEEQHVDPRTDLITLCSNCHRMAHRRLDAIMSVNELKKLLISSIAIPATGGRS